MSVAPIEPGAAAGGLGRSRRTAPGPLARYVLRRLLQGIVVIWAAFTLSFMLLYWLPGDAVFAKLAGGSDSVTYSPQQVQELKQQYGLDQSILAQYFDKLGELVQLQLGTSARTGEPVLEAITEVLPQTLQLAAVALVFSIVLGAGIALAATYTQRPWLRQALSSVPPIGVSLPTFWVGSMLIYVVAFQWRLLPSGGNEGFSNLILPALTLALPSAAMIAQVLAKSMRDTLREPYIDMARAKGVGRMSIHLRHGLRNAALPVVTVIGLVIMHLLAGSAVVETVFTRVGIGRLTVDAVTAQDLPVIQGVVVLAAFAFVVLNLLIDLVYPLLDPRVSLLESGRQGATHG